MLFVAEYRNAVHSGSCLFVSREDGHSCPAKRCAPQGWRWRVRTAWRSRGWVRTRQRQVAVRRLIDSPVFVVAPKAPLIRVFNCAVLDATGSHVSMVLAALINILSLSMVRRGATDPLQFTFCRLQANFSILQILLILSENSTRSTRSTRLLSFRVIRG